MITETVNHDETFLENLPPLKSIEVVNISVYRYAKKILSDFDFDGKALDPKDNISLISDFSVDKFKRMIFLAEGVKDEPKFHALAPKVRGNGLIKFTFVHELKKEMGLIIKPDNFNECFFSLRIGDKIANLELANDIVLIKKFIREFVEM